MGKDWMDMSPRSSILTYFPILGGCYGVATDIHKRKGIETDIDFLPSYSMLSFN